MKKLDNQKLMNKKTFKEGLIIGIITGAIAAIVLFLQ